MANVAKTPSVGTRVIRDLVDVRPHPTVVRLDDLEDAWIIDAYHRTDDVQRHLDALAMVLARPKGLGIFLIGPYGSGKSHFLAYVTRALRAGRLTGGPSGDDPSGADPSVTGSPDAGSPDTGSPDTGSPDTGSPDTGSPDISPLSLLNFPATTSLEEIVAGELGVKRGPGDRREAWRLLANRHPRGLVLIIDELSEFLRSKPDARSFNEDVRFLQFMGERAAGHRFWLIAALQEQIEHTGELEYSLYRKIKDRFPLRFLLTAAHVQDLLAGSILIKKEGYEEAVIELARDVGAALPVLGELGAGDVASGGASGGGGGADWSETLRACYPIHPATLTLLEEVRDRFSQTRGVVDFAVTQLAGCPERNVPAALDRPWGEFLTPEMIVDHFRDLFEIQPEFQPIAQQVFPYYRNHLRELFDARAQRKPAARLIKLLVLTHLTPARDQITVPEAAAWLVVRASRLEPTKNLDVVERILRALADRGRYVAVDEAGGFRLDLKDDGAAQLERLLEREKEDVAGRGEMVFEMVGSLLEQGGVVPFALPRERWEPRTVRWHFHERPIAVYLGQGTPPPVPAGATGLCIRLPWGEAEAVSGATTIIPDRIEPGPDVLELVALARLRDRPWSRDAQRRLTARLEEQLRALASRVRSAYASASCVGPVGERDAPAAIDPAAGLAAWISEHAVRTLRRTYPSFERFAPLEGLPKQAYTELMRFALEHDICDPVAPDLVQVIRDGYLVPMQLLERRGRGYAVPKALDRHELVRLIRPMLDTQPVPQVVYQRLEDPVYRLVPDQVHLLIVFLLTQGELDVVKGRRSYRELYETLANPLQYDRIEPGRALSLEELRDLTILCEGLRIRPPEQWTVLAQRRAVRRLAEVARVERERLGMFLLKLERLGGAEKLVDEAQRLLACWNALDQAEDEIEGFRALLAAAGTPSRLIERVQTMAGMPMRVDRLVAELQRYRHLFGHPAMSREHAPRIASRVAELGAAPDLDEPDDVERWLEKARVLYDDYKRAYAERHAAWWKEWAAAPALTWTLPVVARSKHLGLEAEVKSLADLGARAAMQRCRGLIDLDFQPVCSCGFTGEAAPFGAIVQEIDALRERIEAKLRLFFAQDVARAKVAELAEAGIERGPGVTSFLEGAAPWPEVENLDVVDRRLAGVAVVADVDPDVVVELLCRTTWSRDDLVADFEALVRSWGGERFRFARPDRAASDAIALWCAERALRDGAPLPDGLVPAGQEVVTAGLRAEWVSAAALERLERLGLPEDALDRIAGWLIDGTIPAPAAPTPGARQTAGISALVVAAGEIGRPYAIREPAALAQIAALLYGQHPRMMRVARRRWLARLDALATTVLASAPPAVTEATTSHRDCAWIVVDALSAPLELELRGELDTLLGKWKRVSAEYAFAPRSTTTAAWYRELIDAPKDHRSGPPLEKIDAIDALVHARSPMRSDLVRIAAAELAVAIERLRSRLDPSRPLLVTADHGFRIDPDGGAFVHGGPSTLERLVPVIRYEPALRRRARIALKKAIGTFERARVRLLRHIAFTR